MLFEQGVHFLIRHRVRELVAHLVEALYEVENLAHAFHNRGAHVFRGVELRLLRQKTHADAVLWPRFAIEAGIEAAHDA